MPIDKGMAKKYVEIYIYIQIHTHTHTVEYYSAIRKEGNPTICNNMDGPWGHHA